MECSSVRLLLLTEDKRNAKIHIEKGTPIDGASLRDYERIAAVSCEPRRLLLFVLKKQSNQHDKHRTEAGQCGKQLEQIGICNIVHAITPLS